MTGRSRGALSRSVLVLAGALAVNAPWIVAGALHGSGALSDPRGVEVFAARAEGLLPLPLTILGLGGIWNAEVVPASRLGWPAVAALLLVTAVAVAGIQRWRSVTASRDRNALLVAAVVGVVVTLTGSLAPQVLVWLGETVPGAGLLRDGSRFLALLAPLLACLFGLGVSVVTRLLSAHAVRIAATTALVLAPVALLPDLALGLGGRLQAVQFPSEYSAARGAIDARLQDRGGGDLLLLPFNSYRLPTWNHGRRSLDPLGRFMTPDYLASDTLVVSGVTVAGEDERARRVTELLEQDLDPAELAERLGEEGIAWVLLDEEAQAMVPASVPTARLDGLPVVHEGERLVVWELPDASSTVSSPAVKVAVWAAWWLAGVAVLASASRVAIRVGRARRQSSRPM